MIAFSANSLLNRLALLDQTIGPGSFALIRVVAGALVLAVLLILRDRGQLRPVRPGGVGVLALAAYLLGFSYAYVSMDAGLGALILFGGVQITMFTGALIEGDRPSPARWLGMALAMVGLAILTLPSGPVAISPGAFALMGIASVGWGGYSLIGRGATDPIAATGWNFVYALPVVLAVALIFPDAIRISMKGVALAVVSGGLTSALGYALWYALLPRLGATRGALAQLSVPALTLGLGALLLGEPLTLAAMLSALLILGGILIGLLPIRRARVS